LELETTRHKSLYIIIFNTNSARAAFGLIAFANIFRLQLHHYDRLYTTKHLSIANVDNIE